MNTTTPAQAQIIADHDGDPFSVTVTHAGLRHNSETGATRNQWRWEIKSTTDAAEWQPVRQWSGTDLSTMLDLTDPDPVAALGALGSFLDAYAEAWLRGDEDSDNRNIFPADLPYDLAYDIGEAITMEFPED